MFRTVSVAHEERWNRNSASRIFVWIEELHSDLLEGVYYLPDRMSRQYWTLTPSPEYGNAELGASGVGNTTQGEVESE